MSDLRDTLARRLEHVADKTQAAQEPRINTRGAIMEHYLALADECIRQMKWTYHACRWSSPSTMSWEETLLEDGDMDTGLAPDDWSPE